MRYLLISVGVNGCGSWAEIVDLQTELPYKKHAILSDDGGPSAGFQLLSTHETHAAAVDAATKSGLKLSKDAEKRSVREEQEFSEIQEDILARGGAGPDSYCFPPRVE